jgi:hypothetical protein
MAQGGSRLAAPADSSMRQLPQQPTRLALRGNVEGGLSVVAAKTRRSDVVAEYLDGDVLRSYHSLDLAINHTIKIRKQLSDLANCLFDEWILRCQFFNLGRDNRARLFIALDSSYCKSPNAIDFAIAEKPINPNPFFGFV